MGGIKVHLKEAEKVIRLLKNNNLYDFSRKIKKMEEYVIIPVTSPKEVKKLIKDAIFVRARLSKIKKIKKIKDAVAGKLTNKELKIIRNSYDVVGSIAILEIPKELEKKEKIIAKEIIKMNGRVKTIVKKLGAHIGKFRVQKMKYLAGKKTKETIHRENGVSIKLNVEKAYFSPRLSSERLRISKLVKKGEKVLVMFSGVAPYVCVIAKNSDAKEIVGVEINPEAHKYATENIIINKIKNARLYLGDVKKIVPALQEKFDRIIMPLPKSAEDFLDVAFSASKKGTIIHFYDFLHESEIPHRALYKIEKVCKEKNIKWKLNGYFKCGQHSPRVYRVCVDFEVL
ncbi:MAG: class I SAM-dependent methyltransferase family protein [Candidatus Woesearchaeota archaeon]